MQIHNVYADENGEAHFRDIEVEWVDISLSSKFSELESASGIKFRKTEGDYDFEWHTAPCRQYVINLDAGVEVTVSDGEKRIIAAGEVLLVEDTEGRGHCSKSVNGKLRHSVFIPIN
jgi:hypothetical protein